MLSRRKGRAGDLETDHNGSVMILPFADHIGAVRRVNVSQGVQGTTISTLVELVFWLPNESGPLLLRLGCSCFYLLPRRAAERRGGSKARRKIRPFSWSAGSPAEDIPPLP